MSTMIDTSRIVAESNASYNAKYIQDGTLNGLASCKYQQWYLDTGAFPRFTNSLLLKHHSINNCGLVISGNVYVLSKVNQGVAVFLKYGDSVGIACPISAMGTFSTADEKDVLPSSNVFVKNGSGIATATRVTALPATTVSTTMYVVVPSDN